MLMTKLPKLIIMLFVPISIGVVGQIFLKIGVGQIGRFSMLQKGIILQYIKMFMNPYIFWGIALYGLSTVFWLYLISRVPLSFAFPMLSLSYILIGLASYFIFHETIHPHNWIGMLIIMIGVVFVAWGRT